MKKMFIINEKTFNKMMLVDKVHLDQKERLDEVSRVIEKIEDVLDVDFCTRPKVRRVLDDLIYKSIDRGFSFYTTETLMKNFSVGVTTIREVIKFLKQSGMFFIAHRHQRVKDKNTKSGANSGKGYVIFSKEHVNFSTLKNLLGFGGIEEYQLKYHQEIVKTDVQELEAISRDCTDERIIERTLEKSTTSTGTSVTDEKTGHTVITISLPSSKHVIHNIRARDMFQNSNLLSTDFYNLTGDVTTDSKLHKIMQCMSYKILDRFNRGLDIECISSFCETFITNQFNLMLNAKKEEEIKRKKESTNFKTILEPVPFYNWLVTDTSNLPAKRKLIPTLLLKNIENLKNDCIDDYLVWEKTVVAAASRLNVSSSGSLEEALEFIKLESTNDYASLEIGLWKHLSKNSLLDLVPA